MMHKQEFCDAFEELMTKFDENRDRWTAKHGDDKGFDVWFTAQVAPVGQVEGVA
ncbi:MAG: hypothetical protein WC343_08615 [Bacilli bacterium]|jgi:hypothetical protein